MSDTLSWPGTGDNLPVLSVTELSQTLKSTVEESFAWIRVRGEVSGTKNPASGHVYWSLKDADAVLDAVCWRGAAGRLGIRPEDGMDVIATGRLTTYPGRSKYQIVVESLELAGEGALLKLLEDRKRMLAAEGLFDPACKKPIPFLPDVIGVVTSSSGAAVRDILHRIGDRFPRRVVVWPVLVQGQGAAEQIAAAIDGFDSLPPDGPIPRPDVLIVARGGGSLEDLWAFNEEIVARAVAACSIPLISAVGHETDMTLIDFVSDLRAPTPTAAAEMAVPVRGELLAQAMDDGARLVAAMNRRLSDAGMRLESAGRGLPNLRRLTEDAAQRLDDWSERLTNGLRVGVERKRGRLAECAARLSNPSALIGRARERLDAESRALTQALRGELDNARARLRLASAVLESCSHRRVLERGYALVLDRSGGVIASSGGATPGRGVTLRFADGDAQATIDGLRPRRKRASDSDDGQGTLL